MLYKTIFDTKPKKDNKNAFCKRIVKLLDNIEFCDNGSLYSDGERMLDSMFRYSKLNMGYMNINDLLKEANYNYKDIFKLSNWHLIEDEEILINIDIIINCLYGFKKSDYIYFYNEEDAYNSIRLIFEAIECFLLSMGYKLIINEEKRQIFIIENEMGIDIEQVENEKLRHEIISFYNYKNANDNNEKKKILLILIGNLESRKKEIEKKLGKKIADMFGFYANNFDLRHNNIDKNYKTYYNETIANLSEEEKLKWYDYIFAFMLNIYISLSKVKDVNINDNFQ